MTPANDMVGGLMHARHIPVRVAPGDTVRIELPFSEVCMHLGVAGQAREVQVLPEGAQIMSENGRPFSFPVTHGEAGIYRDAAGLYTYKQEG